MRVALGAKAHSGWAALVVLGGSGDGFEIVDRRRLELVEAAHASWAKQPYHAAERARASDAGALVRRGRAEARRLAARELWAAARRAREAGHTIAACAVLMLDPLPGWSVEEILSVHFRMHKAEGVLFREALAHAAGACGLPLVPILEKQLNQRAEEVLNIPLARLRRGILHLGRSVGPPWGKDQKEAVLAAMIGLQERAR